MRYIYIIVLVFLLATSFSSCGERDANNPGFDYAPQMVVALPYEALSQTEDERHPYNPHGINMRTPAPGTIARGKLDYVYYYANTEEGAELAGIELQNPLQQTAQTFAEGKRLYTIYCSPCHGHTGLNDGPVISTSADDGRFPPPPITFQDERISTLSDGRLYHTITVGRNLMPPYSSQLDPQQRWKVVQYVRHLTQLEQN